MRAERLFYELMSTIAALCPKCARPILASAPKGLCSACLISALFEVGDDDPTAELLEMPTPAALAERVGDYELLAQMGRGGMGVVFRARHLRLNRIVALKLILAGKLASDLEVKRFRTEAEAAAHLDHPNIVPIYEVGESEGRHFFAMKLMEGGTLADRIPAPDRPTTNGFSSIVCGALDIADSVRAITKIARAVHYAHQRGILHRDLKPANILLDPNGEPAVTDFGLARRLEGHSDLTLSGTVVGSPSYMAPEQAAGRSAEITTAADVYSLGAVLFHLLTGRAPFFEDSAVATMRAVMDKEPQRPSALNRAVDRDLETICLKCLEKEPARRYLSAAALADDFERWQRREPILARPPAVAERVWKWARRRPAAAALVGVSAVALAGFVLMQMVSEAKLRLERDRAQAQEGIAKTSERNTRLNLYAADMFLVSGAIEEGNLALASRTLEAHLPRPGQEDLRGFEWRYFWQKSQGQQQRTLRGFSEAVNCVAFSPDGRWLAAGGGPIVQWWNATNYHLVKTAEHDHNSSVRSICFSPDGSTLWTGDSKGMVRFWVEGMAERVGLIRRGTSYVHIAAAAGAIDRVAFGERNGTDGKARGAVALYGMFDALVRNEGGHALTNSGGLAAFSRDGQWLLTGGGNDPVMVHNLRTGETKRIEFTGKEVFALAISPDGRRGALSADNGYGLILLDLTGASPAQYRKFGRVASLAFSPNGTLLALACFNHTVRLLDAKSGVEVRRLDGHAAEVFAVAFSPDGRSLATAGKDQTVRLWDLQHDLSSNVFKGVFAPFIFSADGTAVTAAATDSYPIKFMRYDLNDRHAEPVPGLVLQENTFPDLWNPKNGGLLRSLLEGRASPAQWLKFTNFIGTHLSRRTASAAAADGTVAAIGDKDGKVRLWHLLKAARLPDFHTGKGLVQCIALTSDGGTVAAAGQSNIVVVWNAMTGTNRFRLPPQNDTVGDLMFSPDGRVLAVAGDDGVVQLRDAFSGDLMATLAGHEVGVESIAFSPDGRTLATSGGNTTKLWHLPTRREVATRLPSAGRFLTFSPDGTTLLSSGGWEGEARLFRAPLPGESKALSMLSSP